MKIKFAVLFAVAILFPQHHFLGQENDEAAEPPLVFIDHDPLGAIQNVITATDGLNNKLHGQLKRTLCRSTRMTTRLSPWHVTQMLWLCFLP